MATDQVRPHTSHHAESSEGLYRSITSPATSAHDPSTHPPLRRLNTEGPTSFLPAHTQATTGHVGPREGETWSDFLRDTPGAAYITNGFDNVSSSLTSSRGRRQNHSSERRPSVARSSSSRASRAGHKRAPSTPQQQSGRKRAHGDNFPFRADQGQSLNHGAGEGSSADPIDLTSPDRRPGDRSLPRRRSSNVTLPPWQPDEEVLNCPVCGTLFTWYTRKHHCRKCGKVICAHCSQHRITIPRQFIVHAPLNTTTGPRLSFGASEGASVAAEFARELAAVGLPSNLGGGEIVRVCNPCVPDPNLSPPPGPPPHYGDVATSRHLQYAQRRQPSIPTRTTSATGLDPPPYRRPAGGNGSSSDPSVAISRHAFRFASAEDSHEAFETPNRPAYRSPAAQYPFPRGAAGILPSRPGRTTSDADISWLDQSRSQELRIHDPRQRPELQRRNSNEFCPICNKPFVSLQIDWTDEDAKAGHISQCIETTSSSYSGATRMRASSELVPPRTSTARAAGSARDIDSIMAPLSRGEDLNIRVDSARFSSLHRRGASLSTFSSSQHSMGTQMVQYAATEKDCVGSDGNVIECVICMEDFEPTQTLARLDCLCKFHARCIRQWWETRTIEGHARECPTHKINRDA